MTDTLPVIENEETPPAPVEGAGNGAPRPEDEEEFNRLVELNRLVYKERLNRQARRIVREQEILEEADFDAIDVVTADEMLRRDRPPRRQVLGDLLLEGQNATVVARYKTGKSTLLENMAAALVSGGSFLARFNVSEPMRVAYLNYELAEEDMDARVRALGLDSAEYEQLLVLNLRGRRLPIETDHGRRWLVAELRKHRAEVAFIDPFLAAYAGSGNESENDNSAGRRFLLAFDRVKEEAGCRSGVVAHHTGRGEQVEGDEHGRGMTALDDWTDVRMLLTKDKDGIRFLRTEGRAGDLPESRLNFDHQRRSLWLGAADVGLSRKQARAAGHVALVAKAVSNRPGLNSTALEAELADLGITFNEDKRSAIRTALASGAIHRHSGGGRAQLHFIGRDHAEGEDCGA